MRERQCGGMECANGRKQYERKTIIYHTSDRTMIFRDKKTGSLLNIRRDEFNNDQLYFQEMIRNEGGAESVTLRYSRPFDEITAEAQQYLKPR
jgi:hypothetical protein